MFGDKSPEEGLFCFRNLNLLTQYQDAFDESLD